MPRYYFGRESTALHRGTLLALLLFAPVVLASQDALPKKDEAWKSVRFLIGTWDGAAEGEAGRGTVKRSYDSS